MVTVHKDQKSLKKPARASETRCVRTRYFTVFDYDINSQSLPLWYFTKYSMTFAVLENLNILKSNVSWPINARNICYVVCLFVIIYHWLEDWNLFTTILCVGLIVWLHKKKMECGPSVYLLNVSLAQQLDHSFRQCFISYGIVSDSCLVLTAVLEIAKVIRPKYYKH